MSGPLQFDEAASRRVEATYLTPDIVEQRRAVRAALALRPGEHVLDVGAGPGLLAHEISRDVGPNGRVTAVDPSESMLAIARGRDAAAGSAPVEVVDGDACALPCADRTFDAVVSTQVYEYVDDVAEALAEVARVLRPGGRVVVVDTDWDSIVWYSRDRERMQRVLAAWDEHLVHPHLPCVLGRLLDGAGLTVTQRAVVPLLNAGYDRDSYSAGLIDFIAAFVPGRHGLTEADARGWADDLVGLVREYFFSLNRYLFVARR